MGMLRMHCTGLRCLKRDACIHALPWLLLLYHLRARQAKHEATQAAMQGHSRVPVNLHAHAYGHQMSGVLILDCIRPKSIKGLSLP